jgi:hypothetical protein
MFRRNISPPSSKSEIQPYKIQHDEGSEQRKRNAKDYIRYELATRDSSHSLVTSLRAGKSGVLFPAEARNNTLLRRVQTGSETQPACRRRSIGGSIPRSKAAGE